MKNLNTRSPQSSRIKFALLVAAVCIAIPILLYTHNLVTELQKKQRDTAALYARSLEYLANSTTTPGTDYTFIFDEIIGAIDFPVILTNGTNTEINTTKNIWLDSTFSEEKRTTILFEMMKTMDQENKPISVTYQDSLVLSKVHYGESPLIGRLRWLPVIELSIAALFILVGYIGFSYIKRNEQSNIWVGMARETAHQLGTPLTSMMGWIELLKHQSETYPTLLETVSEFENDARRLTKVAERFSKIGSKPDLKEENLAELINRSIAYFQKRIPQMGKKVDISVNSDAVYLAKVNSELFEWVIENLVKNALDAMEDGKGSIVFSLSTEGKKTFIDVKDTGKGIDSSYQKDIFRPGFSTKKRGWGLGLSLCKRIIETYHNGKLSVLKSTVGEGTTFRIVLKS
ncbi:MAG: HAMP domain-containing sensor histidine kinase [Bacteroidota bacterium]|nr:HAMP domain-containing sensor histidine kinase [Bacteroidota bacterium]